MILWIYVFFRIIMGTLEIEKERRLKVNFQASIDGSNAGMARA